MITVSDAPLISFVNHGKTFDSIARIPTKQKSSDNFVSLLMKLAARSGCTWSVKLERSLLYATLIIGMPLWRDTA